MSFYAGKKFFFSINQVPLFCKQQVKKKYNTQKEVNLKIFILQLKKKKIILNFFINKIFVVKKKTNCCARGVG